MGETEIARFLILGFILLAILIAGIIIFIFEFRRRVTLNEKEKAEINEQHAQELLTSQLEVQQQTMQYIGREIHDNVGQKLTLAALYAQQIDYEKRYPQINDRIVDVSTIINESLSELRSLSKSLTSDYIAQNDLITLIKTECDKVTAASICTINFSCTIDTMNVSYQEKNIIIRIIQEFIQNSLKHAECSLLEISITDSDEGILIGVADNGKGFLEKEVEGKGIGLNNIKKRAEIIDASVKIETQPGAGTNMQLLIPHKVINQ